MLALKVVPEILYFDTFKDFNEEFKLGKGDILVTNEWMYNPYVKPLGIDIPVIFQEKYVTSFTQNKNWLSFCGCMLPGIE